MNTEISLTRLWQIAKRYLILLITISLVAAIAVGVITSIRTKPRYVSSAKVIINNDYESILSPSGNLSEISYIQAIMPTVLESFESVDFLSSLNSTAGTDYSTEQLNSMFSYSNKTDSKVITVTLATPKKADTQKIAAAFSKLAPQFMSRLELVNLIIMDEFKAPKEHIDSPVKPAVMAMLVAFVLTYVICLIIDMYRSRYVSESSNLSERYGLPVLGTIPDLYMDNQNANYKNGGPSRA